MNHRTKLVVTLFTAMIGLSACGGGPDEFQSKTTVTGTAGDLIDSGGSIWTPPPSGSGSGSGSGYTIISAPSLISATFTGFSITDTRLANITSVSLGRRQSCALTSSGAAYCWGQNNFYQLGDGTSADKAKAVKVLNLGGSATHIAQKSDHACAIVAGGVKCWGTNIYGALGRDTSSLAMTSTPTSVPGMSYGSSGISLGHAHTCTINYGGVYCWGSNSISQLGATTTTTIRDTPILATGLNADVSELSSGMFHNCAIRSGQVYCWGDNTYQQSVYTGYSRVSAPAKVRLNSYWGAYDMDSASQLTTGSDHSCALNYGEAFCWGKNTSGQLGSGDKLAKTWPVAVQNLPAPVSKLAAGEDFTCALLSDATVHCWGGNSRGQLGDGTFSDTALPVKVLNLARPVKSLALSGQTACAVLDNGYARCWGANSHGQLGNGETLTNRNLPVSVQYQ